MSNQPDYKSMDVGVEILPVHRLKLKWLVLRSILFSSFYRQLVEDMDNDWKEWESVKATENDLALLDEIYEMAKQFKKEFGI